MKNTKTTNAAGRRGFLKTVALAAGGVSQAQAQAPTGGQPPANGTAMIPAAPAPVTVQYPRTFTGKHLAMIAFPLGGVAAGSVALGGRGQLRDWEIFNRTDKGRSVTYSFPSIWAQAGNSKPVVRVLESKLMPPYEDSGGLSPSQISGLARLDDGGIHLCDWKEAAAMLRMSEAVKRADDGLRHSLQTPGSVRLGELSRETFGGFAFLEQCLRSVSDRKLVAVGRNPDFSNRNHEY